MKSFQVSIPVQGGNVATVFEAVHGRVDNLSVSEHEISMVVTASDDYAASSHVKRLLSEQGIQATLRTRRIR